MIKFYTTAFIVLALPSAMMALLAEKNKVSVPFFISRFFACLAGIVIPIAIFLLSAFLLPEWRGAARHGWIDCFPTGKLALTPLVLWAAWALYQAQIREAGAPITASVVFGLFHGAIVSCVCLGLGIISTSADLLPWLIVPLYVAIWYTASAIAVMQAAGFSWIEYLKALSYSIPFWAGCVCYSRYTYEGLPKDPPRCFVVTAAARGHRRLVGPFSSIERKGGPQLANCQLFTFWNFEAHWQMLSPRTHAVFRRVYDMIGPRIARKITSPWIADAIYIALKPAEFFARTVNGCISMKTVIGARSRMAKTN